MGKVVSKQNCSQNKMLNEIVGIRLLLILQLVVFHAFVPFNGGWTEPSGFVDISLYHYIADCTYAFMLPAFVAMSGYLFHYQWYERSKQSPFIFFIKNKFERLILPSILFSIIYYAIFCDYKSLPNTIYTILNGAGHMWFLPMLFWCYLGGWFIAKLNPNHITVWGLVVCMAILSPFSPYFLRSHETFFYMFFFYLGMNLRNNIKCIDKLRISHLLLVWTLFAVIFISWLCLEPFMKTNFNGSIAREIQCLFNIGYASVGVVALFATARYWFNTHRMPDLLVEYSGYCFGVYLFQQFILKYLYYKTNFPVTVGIYAMPWVASIITLVLSIFFTHLMLKTRMGRKLIG